MNDHNTGEIPDPWEMPDGAGPRLPQVVAVPNVSEGRDWRVIDRLCHAVDRRGARVVNTHSDADHGRTVLTVVGEPLPMQDAMVDLAAASMDLIDVRRVRGIHPRIGSLDVIPIVAVDPSDMAFVMDVARGIAQRIGDELLIPVFRYGTIASNPAHDRPHHFRAGGLDGLAERIGVDLTPDDGPPRLHATAGAVLVGARDPLIALNVWLPTGTLDHARAIAARLRESDGGLPAVRALGLYCAQAAMAQVSMNLEDYRRTSPATAVHAVRREASKLGTEAGATELVGLIPRAALAGTSPTALAIEGFRPGMVLDAYLVNPGH